MREVPRVPRAVPCGASQARTRRERLALAPLAAGVRAPGA
jgi:hypothetical protein